MRLNNQFEFENIFGAVQTIYPLLLKNGTKIKINRKNCREEILELRNLFFTIKEAHLVILPFKNLHQNIIWRQNECLSEILGKNPPLMSFYKTSASEFLEKLELPNGLHNYTYGTRWNESQQLFNIYKILKKDIYSRQAVQTIYNSYDTSPYIWNKSCTILHQYLFRDGKLNLTIYLRSNDAFRGFKYDIYLASFLLQMMSGWLNVSIGEINYFANSFHVYANDLVKLQKLLFEIKNNKINFLENFRFKLSLKNFYKEIKNLNLVEENARFNNFEKCLKLQNKFKSNEFRQWGSNYINYWFK